MVKQYLEHSKDIISHGRYKFNERRGLGRIYLPDYHNKYDLSEGFPLLTTKKMPFKTIAHELIWFLKGETNIKYLVDNKVHIWDDDAFNYNLKNMAKEKVFPEVFKKFSPEWFAAKGEYIQKIKEDSNFAERWGDLGPVYGSQWRHWPKFNPRTIGLADGSQMEVYEKDPKGIDQIANVIENIKKDPLTARHMVTAWNPAEVDNMALPPCHCMFQITSDGKKLDLQLFQRACDHFLGVPFNIASYSLLTNIFAKQTGLEPGQFIHNFGDVHFYTGAGERAKWYMNNLSEFKEMFNAARAYDSFPERSSLEYGQVLSWLNERLPPESPGREGMDHVTGILEQLQRDPRPLPKVTIADKPFDKLTIDDFVLEGYEPHPVINRALAV